MDGGKSARSERSATRLRQWAKSDFGWKRRCVARDRDAPLDSLKDLAARDTDEIVLRRLLENPAVPAESKALVALRLKWCNEPSDPGEIRWGSPRSV